MLIKHQQDAWNRADAAGYSRDCDENITFTNIVGITIIGRRAFEERHAFLFSDIFKGSALGMTIERIHFPLPEFALVDISCTVREYQALPPGITPQKDGALHTCLLEVLTQTENGWTVVAYHNVDTKI